MSDCQTGLTFARPLANYRWTDPFHSPGPADGTITLLNESWKVSKRLAGKYVWATIITHCRRLEIWYQRSAQYPWRLLKNYVYDISETVARLTSEFTCLTNT